MNPVSVMFKSFVEGYINDQSRTIEIDDMPYILTHSGKKFRHLCPRPEDICIEDIAHALSRICRYTGHVDVPHYSVGQHSVLVSYAVPLRKDALAGLMHDATEAYVTDLSTPLKNAPGMEAYKLYEAKVAAAIAERFNLGERPGSVHTADKRLFATEMRDLFSTPQAAIELKYIQEQYPPYPRKITAWSQELAEDVFLRRFLELTQVNELRAFCWPE